MDHWPKNINIWHVTALGHSLIKEHIWQKPGERYRPFVPLVLVEVYRSVFRYVSLTFLIYLL